MSKANRRKEKRTASGLKMLKRSPTAVIGLVIVSIVIFVRYICSLDIAL